MPAAHILCFHPAIILLENTDDLCLCESTLLHLDSLQFQFTLLSNCPIFGEGYLFGEGYHSNQQLLATDCEMHYRTIYHLDKNGFISKRETFAKYDFDGIEESEIKQWKEWVPEHTVVVDSLGINLQVDYYYHSFAKMDGVYPVNKNYEFISDYYYGDQPEKKSIQEGLKKIKN